MARDYPAVRTPGYQAGSLALFLAAASIIGAWIFEAAGYLPCPLCLMQRWAYYAAIPMLFVGLALGSGGRRRAAFWLFGLSALAFLANAGLGVYHAGAEWKFWPGPSDCTGGQPMATNAGALLQQLESVHVIRCDEPAIRIFGLSLAGWNVLASLVIAVAASRAAAAMLQDD